MIGEHLSQLTGAGWLIKQGHGKGTRYSWPDTPQDLLPGANTHLPATSPVTGGVLTGEVTPPVAALLQLLAEAGELGNAEIRERMLLKDRTHLREYYIEPALALNLIEMTIPDKPRSRLQKYRLTVQGHAVLNAASQNDG